MHGKYTMRSKYPLEILSENHNPTTVPLIDLGDCDSKNSISTTLVVYHTIAQMISLKIVHCCLLKDLLSNSLRQ